MALERFLFQSAPGYVHGGEGAQEARLQLGLFQGVQGQDTPELGEAEGGGEVRWSSVFVWSRGWI